MRTLMITAPGEGAGRTTLAGWLGMCAGQAGDGLVVALDATDDQTLVGWAREAGLRQPIAAAWDDSCTRDNFGRLADEGVKLVLADCPVPDDDEPTASVLESADLVLIVVRPQGEDLDAAGSLIDHVEAADKPFVFVINQATDDEDMTASTILALAQHGTVSPVILPQREELALPKGAPEDEASDAQAEFAADMARLWDYLRDCLDRFAPATEPEEEDPEPDQGARHDYHQHATFIVPEMVYPCHVREISADGISFSSDVELPLGARLRFNLPYLGQFVCDVVESGPDKVDARFVIDEARRAELIDQVASLLESGREATASAAAPEDMPVETSPGTSPDFDTRDAGTMQSL
jgi:chromosome partitioning protein